MERTSICTTRDNGAQDEAKYQTNGKTLMLNNQTHHQKMLLWQQLSRQKNYSKMKRTKTMLPRQ